MNISQTSLNMILADLRQIADELNDAPSIEYEDTIEQDDDILEEFNSVFDGRD